MAKKSKSRKRKTRKTTPQPQPQRAVIAQEGASSAPSRASTTARRGGPARQVRAEVDFASEYSYVYADLKRVAVIAAAMVVILVALAFVLA